MRLTGGRVIGVTAALVVLSAGPAAAIAGPRPAAGTFTGTITSAAGGYAGDHGRVVIRDADLVSRMSGRVVLSGLACRGARHCLDLDGKPVATLALKGHPIPDAGYTFTVRGSGRVAPLGAVKVSGLLQVPGFVACGRQSLTLTLASTRGRVKVTAQTRLRCAGPPD